MSSPRVIEPFAKPKVRDVTPVELEELLTESESREIAELPEIDTPASVVVDRAKDTPPPWIDEAFPPASV
jgi:hypothetical protein